MDFAWDERKSDKNYGERGFDFAYAALLFLDPNRLERIDTRKDYGEERRQTIGMIDGRLFFAAFTVRGDVVRIISARRAHPNEEELYHARQA